MIYVSADNETMCIKPMHPTRLIGASFVVENSDRPDIPVKELPHFTFLVDHGEEITGSYEALAMNARYLNMIAQHKRGKSVPYRVLKTMAQDPLGCWEIQLFNFMMRHVGKERAVLAGKNIGFFDVHFWPSNVQDRFIHRMIDVGSALIDFSQPRPPSMDDLKTKFGMGDVSHDMYEDACDNITLLRKHPTYPKAPGTPQSVG